MLFDDLGIRNNFPWSIMIFIIMIYPFVLIGRLIKLIFKK